MAEKMPKLRKKLGREPLSVRLLTALRLADRVADSDLKNWCRLELGGYFGSNPTMTEDTVVPEYRSVVGQHVDIYGRPLVLKAKLAFINETRLRNGVEELESLCSSRDLVTIRDPSMCELIQEHLGVQVYVFRFSSVNLTGILASIGLELEERLGKLGPETRADEVPTAPRKDEILELKPSIYGIGVDLRALWRRIRGGSERSSR